MKICSTKLVIREIGFKTNVRYMRFHFMRRMAIINKWRQEYREKGTLLCYWWKCKVVESLWKTVWRHEMKSKVEISDDLPILLISIHLKEVRLSSHKDVYIWEKICTFDGWYLQYHPFTCKQDNFILLYGWIKLHCVYISHFLHLFMRQGPYELLPKFGYCK
jgi:hypothetical protein